MPTGKTDSQSPTVSKAASTSSKKQYFIDIHQLRWVFIVFSVVFLLPGVFYLIANTVNPSIGSPLRLGIDFKGGTLLQYGFSTPVKHEQLNQVKTVFEEAGQAETIIQISAPRVGINQEPVQLGAVSPEANEKENRSASEEASQQSIKTILSIKTKTLQTNVEQKIRQSLEKTFGAITVLQRNSIGPSLAKELMQNGVIALLLAYVLIVGYLTVRFQFDFAICAMIALVHDTLFLFGVFALLGHFFGTEIDSLFVTALLTVIGFSVHDTIVVFDRIRENIKRHYSKKLPFREVVNLSIDQTLARSINTSITALLPMLALLFFGGESTKDFVLAIIIGITAGTYSSIFNASVILTLWRDRQSTVHKKA
ncbi:MAG: protein translocase subunit SecF [Cyanobacteria bacterium P01_H01_bin.74]